MDYSEKRDFQRMAIGCSLEYQLENDTQIYQGKVVNLSGKGVLFTASNAIKAGANIKIIVIPGNSLTPPMSADILVLRCDKQSDKKFHIAAEIVQIH